MSLTSSFMHVPLLVPEELRDGVLSGAAEIVVEQGNQPRFFLHVYSEEERSSQVQRISDPNDPLRKVHEKRLEELRRAREVLWAEPRIQKFLRFSNHLLWPAQDSLSRVVDVVRQLILCEPGDAAATLRRVQDMAHANDVLRREASQPGLHPLKETRLAGIPTIYAVQHTRKRSRDSDAALLPFVLTQAQQEPVHAAALIAELKQVSYTVSDVLRLTLAIDPLGKLVRLLKPPCSPEPLSMATPALIRTRWRGLLEQHRQWATHHSLFADVRECCRAWGATEESVMDALHEAMEDDCSVQVRTGVYASVLHRRELFIFLCRHPRKLESFSTAEVAAFAELYPSHLWKRCLEKGIMRLHILPSGELSGASLEKVIRQLFLSPAWGDGEFSDGYVVGTPDALTAELQVMHVSSTFNPFVVLHGNRVENGFEGNSAFFHSLQRERDRLVEDGTDEQLRRDLVGASSPNPSTRTPTLVAAATAPQRQGPSTSLNSDAVTDLNRALISALAQNPLTRAELHVHPLMRHFSAASNFDSAVRAALKEHAEFRGRKYHLRD